LGGVISAQRQGEKREVSYFVRTDLPLFKDGSKVSDAIYQRIDKPQFYYIADEDIMFNVERQFMIGCGAGGFSIRSPKLRNFILCSYPYSPGCRSADTQIFGEEACGARRYPTSAFTKPGIDGGGAAPREGEAGAAVAVIVDDGAAVAKLFAFDANA
jgi:hypothetical protein